MVDTWLVFGAVVVTSIVAPVVLTFFTGHQRREDKREDWARQDQVKADLMAENKRVADVLQAENRKVMESSQLTQEKLNEVHTLVNSNLTAELRDGRDSTQRILALMGEVIELRRASGKEPTAETLAVYESTRRKLAEQDAVLADRTPAG